MSQASDQALAMRKAIAAAMTRSKREIPHYYLGTTVDMLAAMQWLESHNRQKPVTERLLYGVLLIKAVANALIRWSEFNGHWINDEFQPGAGIHVGVAIARRSSGLVAPALRDADKMNLEELMKAFLDLVNRARNGRLTASEMSMPTMTVTSLGERGVETVYPVIYPPQVAIVGFGRIVQRPVVTDEGNIEAHPVLHASLAGDHRVSDGHHGGLFLAGIERLLQEPEKL